MKKETIGTKKTHSFCETSDEKCTMNYCDENGCQNRKIELVETQLTNEQIINIGRNDDIKISEDFTITPKLRWLNKAVKIDETLGRYENVLQQLHQGCFGSEKWVDVEIVN